MSISKHMTSIINNGPHNYNVSTVDTPEPKDNELLVKVEGSGICGSDVHCFHGGNSYWGGTNPRVKAPITPGHEFVARVVKLGKGAKEHFDVEVGDRVIAEQLVPCNKCYFCKTGKYWMCQPHTIFGFQINGSWSEYMIFPENARVFKVPDSLPLEDACFIEPMACAMHAVDRANVGFSDVVVVAGAGPLGLGIVQCIRLKTPKYLIVIDLDDTKLELAKFFGATHIINAKTEDAIQIVKDLTSGYGCDVYIEATGHPSGVTQGLDMIRKLGRFIQFSVFGGDVTANFELIGNGKELDLLGAHIGPYLYPTVIDLMERKLLTGKNIVTHQFKLDEFQEAMKTAESQNSIKVLLIP